jgi:hypothetical protein
METMSHNPEEENIKTQTALELFHLSEDQVADLRARLDQHNGALRIFVHPFYWLARKDEASQTQIDNSIETIGFLEKLLAKDKDSTPPILILEEDILAEEAGLALQSFSEKSQNIFYYCPTFNNEGTPKFPGDAEALPEDEIIKRWNDFSVILKSIGAKKIIIAGGDFDVQLLTKEQRAELNSAIQPFLAQRESKGAKNLNYTPKACAGTVAAMLAHNFKVEISNFAKPISLSGLRTIEQ